VVVEAAAEAEPVAALAPHAGDDGVEGLARDVALDGVLAVGRGTPPQGGIVVDVGPVDEHLVPVRRCHGDHISTKRDSNALLADRGRHEELDGLLVDDELAI
jgi:hypothetical protein